MFLGALKFAAAHGSKTSHLSLAATRALNFRNYGLSVKADSDPEQRNIITKSIAKCIAEGATVLIYPELGINESVLPFLMDTLNTGSGNLKLVVGASQYLSNSDDSYYNSAPILAKTQNGWELITRYNKMIPFSMGYSDTIAEAYHIDKTVVPPSKYDLLVEDIRMSFRSPPWSRYYIRQRSRTRESHQMSWSIVARCTRCNGDSEILLQAKESTEAPSY